MNITAKFKEDAADVVRLQVENENGVSINKVVSFSDFLTCLNESVVNLDDTLRVGKLPNGYYDSSISPTVENTFRCSLVVPEGIRSMVYFDKEYVLPFPTLAFEFRTVRGAVSQTHVFALRDEPTDEAPLYHYPFGNVYGDARICWGGNKLPRIQSLKDFEKLILLFFGSPTNNDLYSEQNFVSNAPEYVATQRSLLEEVSKMQQFPVEILKETGVHLGDLLN